MGSSDATRFMVWRTFHRLTEELGRAPFIGEIAEVAGLHAQTLWRHLQGLGSCPTYPQGYYRVEPADNDITLCVVEFIEENS